MTERVAIIGGGIAGLAAGYHLVRAGIRRVTLFEREPVLFAMSSGRNAAIYRPLELDPAVTALALRSANLIDELLGTRAAWLRERGLLFIAADALSVDRLAAAAARAGVALTTLEKRELDAAAPILRAGQARHGALLRQAGELDTHFIMTALARAFRARDGSVRTGVDVARIEQSRGRVTGVVASSGERHRCDTVVVAAGAWAAEIGRACGASIQLSLLRRHLISLALDEPAPAVTVWGLEHDCYFRPEASGVLASPGDARRMSTPDYRASPRALAMLFERASRIAPPIAKARVQRFWACLRSVASDGRPVIGEDARVAGLHWLVGLGGSGMSVGMAAGEVLARAVLGAAHEDDAVFSPARFTAIGPGSSC